MSPASRQPDPVRARLRRVARPWRLAFFAYALGLTTGTHWPNLEIGPEVPASDKIIHMLAFGGLFILFRQARWITRLWLLWIVVMVWAAIDETSQQLPGLNRTVSIYDYMADTLGITTAMALLWSIGPIGSAANRRRLRSLAFIFDEMFAKARPWVAAIGVFMAAGAVLAVLLPRLTAETDRIVILVALFISGITTLTLWWRQWNKTAQACNARRPCLACGETAAAGLDRCRACGEATGRGTWEGGNAPPLKRMITMGRRPLLAAVIVLAGGFALIFATPLAYAWLIEHRAGGWLAPRLVRMVGAMPAELNNTIDFAALLLLLAGVVRLYRAALARFHDRAARCEGCGHDLRGTPTDERGRGRCGECGREFDASPA